ncbi:hypothetical protein DFH05DRAFT_1470299 [Lentinula detonsa]|uniref:PEBP-like protein n=1 Tax=Lentinula detonsa TaxID=2804962 RepID=A0A9W8PC60_9AGAR|nr:hypothetical protein DFH05DRAFT_1470299 [Lentinula detonsa]
MFTLPLRRTSHAARVISRSVSVTAPKYAGAVEGALPKEEPPAVPVLGEAKAAATKPSSLPPLPAKPKAPASTSGRRKTGPLRKRALPTPTSVDPATTLNTKRRPHISTDKPKKWNRPIAEGVLPAYDEALKIIIRDSEDLTKEAKELGKKIDALETEAEEVKDNTEKLNEILKELEAMRERYHILSVQSQINMPSVRWTVANAQLDPWSPAHLHLAEQRWRGEGGLDILMERLHQMHVVPDLLSGIHPSLDLHVTVPYPLNKQFKRSMKSGGKSIVGVEPGSFLSPTQTARAPGLWAHAWHSDVRLYTMVMLDPDVPDQETRSFTTYVHWMKPNIPVSAVAEPRAFISPALLNSHTTYVPPHPQQGTPYHRYTILLLPQPPKTIYSRNVEAKFFKDLAKHNLEYETIGKRVKELLAKKAEAKGQDDTKGLSPAESQELQILLKQSTTTHADLSISSPTSWPLPLLKKYTTSQWLDIPIVSDSQRRGFNLRKFVREWGLSGSEDLTLKDIGGVSSLGGGTSGQSLSGLRTQVNGGKGLDSEKNHAIVVGGGVHMFREVWDETVTGVFKTSVAKGGKIEERYTLPKKVDRYEGLKGVRKYI